MKSLKDSFFELFQVCRENPVLVSKFVYELLKKNVLLPAEKKLESVTRPNVLGFDRSFAEYLRPIFQFMFDSYFRVDVEGAKNIPSKGPAIITPNHSGCLPYDGAMIHMAVYDHHPKSREVRFLVDDFAYRVPLLRLALERVGAVEASRENAQRLLKHKELLCIFPEGVDGVSKLYSQRYRLQGFGHGGVVRLAIKNKAPVIPCAVIGAEEVHPILWKSKDWGKLFGLPFIPITLTFPWLGPLGILPLPTKWKIVFGKPIHFDYPVKKTEDKKLVMKLTSQLKVTVQKMIDQELKKRRSIWG